MAGGGARIIRPIHRPHPSGRCRYVAPVRDRILRSSTSLATVLTLELLVIKKAPVWGLFYQYGWGTRIRTLVGGVRVRSPAARRSPISLVKRCQAVRPDNILTFRELWCFTCLVQAKFLTLNLTCIAGYKTCSAQW